MSCERSLPSVCKARSRARLPTSSHIITHSAIWFELSAWGATLPHLTGKVAQNTRPSFLHVQGGSGHETRQWWVQNASLIPIPQSTAIMACSMNSTTCTASNDSCSGGLGTKLVSLGCVSSLMPGSSSPGEQLVCVDTGGWFCLVVALWAARNSKSTSSGADWGNHISKTYVHFDTKVGSRVAPGKHWHGSVIWI